MATDFTSYLGVQFKFDSAEDREDIVKLINDLDYFEKKLKGNFDTKAITDWNNKIDTAKQGLNEFGIQVDTVTQQSYQNCRAIGQMDRITREFASGGLTSGLNGLTMFGNSLTRLAVQEGGFKNALGGLVGAFTGPAGIVLAISAVIGFFEEYSKSIKKAEDENKKFIDSLNEINKAAYKIAGGAQAKLATGNVLIGVISDTSKDIETRKSALASLKTLYGDSKEIQDLDIKNKNINNRELLNYAINRAAVQQVDIENQKNEENKLTVLFEQKRIRDAKYKQDLANIKPIYTRGELTTTVADQKDVLDKAYKISTDNLNTQIAEAQKQNKTFAEASSQFPVIDKSANKELTDAEKEKIALLEYDIRQTEKWANEQMKIHDKVSANAKKGTTIDWRDTIEGARNPDLDVPDWMIRQMGGKNIATEKIDYKKIEPVAIKDYESGQKEEADALKIRTEMYKKFANTISGEMTNAFRSMVDGISSGKDALDQLGQSFLKLAEDIAFTIIKEELFAGISAALGLNKTQTGTGADTTTSGSGVDVGSIISLIAKIAPLFLADGGVVSSPTLAMVGEGSQPEAVMPLSKLSSMMNSTFSAGAMSGSGMGGSGQFTLKGNDLVLALQRSNYSLNLRRGA